MRKRHPKYHPEAKAPDNCPKSQKPPLSVTGGRSAISTVALVLANLVPLFGVLFLKWDIFSIMILFWLENVILGFFNVLRMLFASGPTDSPAVSKIFCIPFFILHYGTFCMVHGVFVIGLFGGGLPEGNLGAIGHRIMDVVVSNALLGAIGFVVGHATSFLKDYIGRGEYRQADLRKIMASPYGRIIVLHLTVLGGGYLVLRIGSPVAALLVLIVLKTVLDFRQRSAEPRKKRHAGIRIPKMIRN